ncbi:hypothetical protein ACE103_09805 [Bradyrhizobium sp. ma5]|uniref:hypothetical protein n=1 Tax=Bradyrhizobium sp. ma5 TaxID=3344828 RepID=UPI0035D3E4DD
MIPYLWLEQVEGARALKFVEQQNGKTLQVLGGAAFEWDRDALASIYDRADKIPSVSPCGGYLYNLWKDADNPRGLWRRTRTPNPSWDVLLDIDQVAASEGGDWLLTRAAFLPRNWTGDFSVVARRQRRRHPARVRYGREDLVRDGFGLPEAKSDVEWLDPDTLVLTSSYGSGMATTCGYARTVRLWWRGTRTDQAPVIFELPANHVIAKCGDDHTVVLARMWFVDQPDTFNSL